MPIVVGCRHRQFRRVGPRFAAVAGSVNPSGPGERRRAVEGLLVPIVAGSVNVAAVPIVAGSVNSSGPGERRRAVEGLPRGSRPLPPSAVAAGSCGGFRAQTSAASGGAFIGVPAVVGRACAVGCGDFPAVSLGAPIAGVFAWSVTKGKLGLWRRCAPRAGAFRSGPSQGGLSAGSVLSAHVATCGHSLRSAAAGSVLTGQVVAGRESGVLVDLWGGRRQSN